MKEFEEAKKLYQDTPVPEELAARDRKSVV